MNPDFDFCAAVRLAALHVSADATVADTEELGSDANETYVVRLSDGERLVVRILHYTDADGARREVPIQQALTAAGIVTPVSLMLAGDDVVGRVSGADFTVSRFIDGHHPTQFSPALVADVGLALASFHRALQGLTVSGTCWMHPQRVADAVQQVRDPAFRHELADLQRRSAAFFTSGLPEVNIHGDVWPGNLFADDTHVTAVLDIETVELLPRIVDIGRTAAAIAAVSAWSPEYLLTTIASAYNADEPLSPLERELLPLAFCHGTIASAAWNFENGHPDQARALAHRAQEVGRASAR